MSKHFETMPQNLDSQSCNCNHHFTEEVFTTSLDRCFKDALVKTSGGLFAGILVSTLILKRPIWPLWLGMGFGLGSAYAECEKKIQSLTDARGLHKDVFQVKDNLF